MTTNRSKLESRMAIASHFANLVIAVTFVISAVIALGELDAIHEQVESVHRQTGVDALWRLHDRMTADSMQENLAVLRSTPKPTTAETLLGWTPEGNALRDLANFYEMLALNVNSGYLEYKDVKAYIGADITVYWEGVGDAITTLREREERPSMFCELEKLAARINQETATRSAKIEAIGTQ